MALVGLENSGFDDRTPLGFVPIASFDTTDFFNELKIGLKNMWYNFTGQTEKTSAYQAQLEQENTKMQRLAEDMENAGLSKYGITASGSAPSSVAGDQEPKGLQYIAAMMDLKKQSAEIENINANSSKTAAEADYIGKQSASYPERVAVEIALNKANTELSQRNGQLVAEKIITEIQTRTQSAAMHLVQLAQEQARTANIKTDTWLKNNQGLKVGKETELLGKEIGSYDARRAEERGYNIARTALLGTQNMFTFKQIEDISSNIAYRLAQQEHLGYQDEKLIAETSATLLSNEIMQYNFDYSKLHGLRTTDGVSRFMGVNLDAPADALFKFTSDQIEKTKQFADALWNYGGVLGLPSFADLFGR